MIPARGPQAEFLSINVMQSVECNHCKAIGGYLGLLEAIGATWGYWCYLGLPGATWLPGGKSRQVG